LGAYPATGFGDPHVCIEQYRVNVEQTFRTAGSKSDPYAVFEKMLEKGNPPDDWEQLVAASRSDWSGRETQ
jgi:toxin YhaV